MALDDVGNWLRDLGLERYTAAFRDNEIDLELLATLTADDLKEMGVAVVGHRRRLLNAIAELDSVQPQSPKIAVDAERRQLTVMFVDLVGSTALSGALDPEALREVILAYQNAVAGEAARFAGHVAKFMGDGVLVYFGWPQAHEDDAERAVRAGLAMVHATGALRTPDGEPLAVRLGIATGLVVVGDLIGQGAAQEEAVVGETPNLAARLQTEAAPGQVVVSQATRELLGDHFDLADLGARALKGMAGPVQAFAVVGERALESRFAARGGVLPLVGREQELALLLERWRQAVAGEGQMVLLSGEAGIGKSRITRAMIDALADQPHTRVSYQCSPYHGDSALYPMIQQLGLAAGFLADEGSAAKLDKLEALLAQSSDDVPQVAPLIAALLGLEGEARYGPLALGPEQQRARTLQALVGQLTGLARRRPVLFVLEDAHWIDPTTLELVELCLERIAGARVLLLATARPSFDHGFGGHPIVTRLALNRLGRAQTTAIIERLSGGKTLPEALLAEIAAKTDGVPLFVEELTKAVLESGETGIPASLHDSLMARLDRIPDVKAVAQIAATIGRTFDYPLLAAIAGRSEPELLTCLDKLGEAELVFCRGRPPEARYSFKHALVRDAAYESLLKSRRQELHAKIAEVLEAAMPETPPELLAQHYGAAGQARAAAEKWLLAGDHSARRAANREAVAQLHRGLELIERIDEGPERWRLELDLVMTLSGCLRTLKGWMDEETVEAVFRARRLSDQLAGAPERGVIGLGEYTVRLLRCELDEAVEVGRELLRLAQPEGSAVAPYLGHRAVGIALFHQGHLKQALDHLDSGIACYDPTLERDTVHRIGYFSGVALHAYQAHVRWHFGRTDESLESLERAIALAIEERHTPSQAFAYFQAVYHFGPTSCAMTTRRPKV